MSKIIFTEWAGDVKRVSVGIMRLDFLKIANLYTAPIFVVLGAVWQVYLYDLPKKCL